MPHTEQTARRRTARPHKTRLELRCLLTLRTGGQGVAGSNPAVPTQVRGQIRNLESAFWCTWGPRSTDGCVLALLDRWSSAGSDRACARPEAADPAVAPCAPDLGGSGPEQIPFHLEML